MTVYSRQIATALRLIAKKGQAAVWQKETEVVNNAQPWKTSAGAPATFPVVVVRLPTDGPTEALMPGTSVTNKREKLLMGAVSFVPAVNDTVLIGIDTVVVESIKVLQPDGTPILYTIIVR